MSIEQLSTAVKFVCFYAKDGLGVTGLTVTLDVRNPSGTEIVTGASATEVGDGFYSYTLSSGSTGSEGEYLAVFKTAGDVDQKHLPSLWVIGRGGVENLDATVSSRNSTTPPTASSIRTELDSNSTKLANLDAAISTRATPGDVLAATGGGGSIEHIHTSRDSNSNPLDGVSVWVTTGTSESVGIAASGVTDAFGRVELMLDPGTYYLWQQRSGINFNNPQEITVQ